MKSFYQNDYASYELEHDILRVTYKKKIIELTSAQQIVADRLRFQNHEHMLVLCDVNNVLYMTYEARLYLAQYGSNLITACALMCTDYPRECMAHFYIGVNLPNIPTEVFRNELSAMHYLRTFKKHD